ncbi:MAG: Sec-independent protein translocase protein TatB [Pseudomonadota bacterium]
MFDIGFWELSLIAVVGLLVIGPERLPKVARTVGLWVGRMRGFVTSVKADIDKELRAEELKRVMEEHTRSSGIHEILEETKSSVEEMNKPDYLVRAMQDEQGKGSPAAETRADNGGDAGKSGEAVQAPSADETEKGEQAQSEPAKKHEQ